MKKIFIIIVIILIIALVVLAIILGSKKEQGEESSVIEEMNIPEEIYGLSGEIKEIRDRILVVGAKILLADPREEPIKEIVKIKVTDETKILKLKFSKEVLEGSIEPVFPEKTEVNFGDLKVGDKIDIETIDNVSENIKNRTEITASTINIIE